MSHQLWMTLIKYSISPNQLYYLDCCRQKIKPSSIIDDHQARLNCKAAGYILEDGSLSTAALQLLDEFETLLVKTKRIVATDVLGDGFLDRIKEYRELFPAKRLGSGLLARQSVQELKDKFVWFFKTYPEYGWDLVLDAAKYYNIMKEREHYQFMTTSSYFIQKTDLKSKVSKSELADYCQLILEDPDVLINL